ncbi:MAG: Crp/Fnr family transcriptional regulator [Paludibacter sp.]
MSDLTKEWKEFENIENSFFPDDLIFSIKSYRKKDIVFHQGDPCVALYIVMTGSVKTEMITESGNLMPIETIHAPRPLAPAFLFSDRNQFPVEVTAITAVELLRIPKTEVMRLMTLKPDFMQQFMTHNANRTQFLTQRMQLLSIKTIKGKIAHLLLEKHQSDGLTLTLSKNQTELAEYLGVARPSLSRSLSEMMEENIISCDKNTYKILNLNLLKELLL